jgi:regulator of replication initiation timing
MGADMYFNPPPDPPLWEQIRRICEDRKDLEKELVALEEENRYLKLKNAKLLEKLGEQALDE